MEIAIVVIAGVVIVTIVCMVGDHITKVRLANISTDSKALPEMTKRIEQLDRQVQDQASKISTLETEVAFTNKLLENKK